MAKSLYKRLFIAHNVTTFAKIVWNSSVGVGLKKVVFWLFFGVDAINPYRKKRPQPIVFDFDYAQSTNFVKTKKMTNTDLYLQFENFIYCY